MNVPEEYGFSFDHEGGLDDMSSRMEFTLNTKKTNLETRYKNDGRNIQS